MPTEYSIHIRPDTVYIQWPAESFSKDDAICIETYTREFVHNHTSRPQISPTHSINSSGLETIITSTEHLLSLLEHPRTQWDALCESECTLTLQLSYWILFDVRDQSLDGESSGVHFSVENDYMRNLPITTLDTSQICRLRSLLLKPTNLVVEFTETGVHTYGPYLKACYVGVIRTFPNISELNYSWCDKYGWPVMEHIWDCYERWKARTARCITLCGSDDNCGIGTCSEKHNYFQQGDGDLLDPELGMYCWDDLLEQISEPCRIGVKFMSLWHLEIKAGIGTPALAGMSQFPNLRDVHMGASIELSETDCILHEPTGEQYWIVDIPAMPNMVSFELEIHEWHTDCKEPILLFRFGASPRLREVNICLAGISRAWGVIVREGHARELIRAA